MNVKIYKSELNGTIKIPPSKSVSHRVIIAACIATGISKITNVVYSEDILATIAVMKKLGAKIITNEDSLEITGNSIEVVDNYLYCNDSASTMRFVIPIALTTGEELIIDGSEQLRKRPLWPYYNVFKQANIEYKNLEESVSPMLLNGKLESGHYSIVGDVSSQFITGLLYALTLTSGKSTLQIENKLQSVGYVDITIDILRKFGADIINNDYQLFTINHSKLRAIDYEVEGDYSQLAFFILAGIVGKEVTVEGLNVDSIQGDKAILKILEDLQIPYSYQDGNYTFYNTRAQNCEVDISDVPDFGPVLFCIGAISDGVMIVKGIERLRIKESDRVSAMVSELQKMGANIEDKGSYVKIVGKQTLEGGVTLNSHEDHRIVMSLTVLASIAKNPVTINGAEAINKSYPNFFDDMKMLNLKTSIKE